MKDNRIKVIYDHSIFSTQRYGGISRYFYEIIKRMKSVDTKMLLLFSDNAYIKDSGVTSYLPIPHSVFKIFKGMFRNISQRYTLLRLENGKYVFHPTYYNTYFLNHIQDNPFVITVHDMIHEIYPQYFSPNDATAVQKKLLVEKATRVIAISQHTKQDLINILGVSPDKIDVIYHGINPTMMKYNGLSLPKRYILYVGGRNGYKNFANFAKAFSQIHAQDAELQLLCTGKRFNSGEIQLFKSLNISSAVSIIEANDKELAQLYQQAQLFVYPSLYEGFGIPILESWVNRCPVVLSNASCFPEIAGDGAEYFEPNDVEDIKKSISNVLYDSNRRDKLIAIGSERLKLYSWDETARLTELTYRKASNIN